MTFKERLHKPAGQWIKCACWSLVYILFILWVGNLWWLLLLPFIFDAFITKYVPWTWWKKLKNKTLYTLMSWVDAIVFALVAVYFINQYLFQNYQIPSSSLEKTLLTGDFLFVSKAAYGPRIPETPLSMPLMQHTMPQWLGGGKSYIERPHWDYRRLAGLDTVSRGDIVVFNFPAGDTVCLNMQNPDYYTLCYYYGREEVNHDERRFGKVVYRPTDRRENYVKRCVGLPGDSLKIVDNQIYVNNQPLTDHEGVQYNYFVQTHGLLFNKKMYEQMGIAVEDREMLDNSPMAAAELQVLGLDPELTTYHLPLTQANVEALRRNPLVESVTVEPDLMGGEVYPLGHNHWTRDNYGPVYMPRRGETLDITPANYHVYERCIRDYEHNRCELRDSTVYINGQPATQYTFQLNYYWMMGDNRHRSADSRYWGFVPEDHVVGRPVFIWLSLDKDKGWFNGKVRWKRLFRSARL